MKTYIAIQNAFDEIRSAYEAEITKWYRIRRQALKHGHTELARKILEEIESTKHDLACMDFTDWEYKYKYLFQMDKPAHHYHPFQTGYYPGCYGDGLDDC